MKQAFNNEEVSVVYTTDKNQDNSINGHFYVSNNTSSLLTNIKLTFSVTKNVNLKVVSTSGNSIEPQRRLGITKVNQILIFLFKEITLTNNEPEKKVVIKLKLVYNYNDQEVI